MQLVSATIQLLQQCISLCLLTSPQSILQYIQNMAAHNVMPQNHFLQYSAAVTLASSLAMHPAQTKTHALSCQTPSLLGLHNWHLDSYNHP